MPSSGSLWMPVAMDRRTCGLKPSMDGWWKDGAFKGRYEDEPRSNPVDYGEPYTLDNHPVVGISWYEALAFARWLDINFKGVQKRRWKR